ncbi:hypothetical protein V9T40_008819 [Parthenolecanium corni]|uniref:Uncharacterized protein n=1 Tax=Parthenolecanium corni TaxID=536013 RepID=A0AAN9TNT9_9HEMI
MDPDSSNWPSKCESITTTFCRDIEYNITVFPNRLNHSTQKEASHAIGQYISALKAKCSPDIQFFLCSLYFPICTELRDPLPPCKSLCQSVQNGCKDILVAFHLKWPEELDCNKFPETQPCVHKNVSVSGVGDLRPTMGLPDAGTASRDFAFTCPDQFRVPKGYEDSLRVGQVTAKNCGLPCDDMFFSNDERRLSRMWVGTWSIICAISCLFTVLTFMLNTSRFRYPERPIIFLSVCYLVVSIIYAIGFITGDRVACRPPFPSPQKRLQMVSTIVQGTKVAPCTIMFIGLYFFTMASSLWWVILALTWFLAAGLKWSHEAIEANSQYFHLAAWAIPAIKTISILALGKIEGDVLTGVCYIGLWDPDIARSFILAPLLVYLVFGTIFLMLGFVSLFHIRTAMKRDGSKTDKLEKLMLRIGIFSVLYTLPAVTVIVCLIYEQMNFDHWIVSWHRRICHANSADLYLIRCPSDDGLGLNRKPNFYVFMLKYLSSLIVGVTSCVWIASHKTLASWKELFSKILRKHGQTYV